jgi:phosphohistidine swiveling domain-containing protein
VAITRRLEELTAADASRFGGKAVQCGVLLQAGFPVPEGIAVAFEAGDEAHLPEDARVWIAARPSMRFAVRSSAADEDGTGNSFAGIHESVLDVGADGIEDAIATCVASMSSDRARAYREARGLDANRGAAVLIQRMIEPRRAGVAFTADPINGERGTIVINAAAGRGEAVVSGTVAPEETRVRKSEACDPLAKLMLRVEEYYGVPQDVEWCDDGACIWIVQSRPITSLGDNIEWSRANLREVLPDLPAPGVVETLLDMVSTAYARSFGTLLDPKLGPLQRIICGRPYFNITQFRRIAKIIGQSEAAMLRSIGHAGDFTPDEEKPSKIRLRNLLSVARPLLYTSWHQLIIRKTVPRRVAELRAMHDRFRALDVASATNEELLRRLRDWREVSYDYIFPSFMLAGVMTFERMARDLCDDRVLQTWLSAGERSVSSQQGLDVLRIARGEMTLDAFLELYGHRGIYETDWSLPRFAEDPTPILEAVRAHQAAGDIPDPDAIVRKQQEAWDQLRREVKPGWVLNWLLRRIKWMYLWRERYRSELIRVIAVLRVWHLELARRFVQRGWLDDVEQYFALTLDELARDPSTYRPVASEKLRLRAEWAKIEMPLLLGSGRPARLRWADGTSALQGHCISAGFVEAQICVVAHPSEIARFPRGAILVTAATDPSWTPLFTLASGVIVEVGGTLSHAATVAREMGLPALANVRDATRILKDGMCVRLDATNGYAAIV